MELGDFFKSAPYARPVNPKQVKFTAISGEKVLPGGTDNPSGRQVKASVTACLVFLDGVETERLRFTAQREIRTRAVDGKTNLPFEPDAMDVQYEIRYQMLAAAIREYDERAHTAGEPLFRAGAKQMRQLVNYNEMMRVWKLYEEYVEEEHPEGLDARTFREAAGTGQAMAAGAPA